MKKSYKIAKNIAQELAHPFIGLLPNQDYFDKKIPWYNPGKGVIETAIPEILGPLMYLSSRPTELHPVEMIIGGVAMLDGIWRLNQTTLEKRLGENDQTHLGTVISEMPYHFFKSKK
jgi:hypothetical protein